MLGDTVGYFNFQACGKFARQKSKKDSAKDNPGGRKDQSQPSHSGSYYIIYIIINTFFRGLLLSAWQFLFILGYLFLFYFRGIAELEEGKGSGVITWSALSSNLKSMSTKAGDEPDSLEVEVEEGPLGAKGRRQQLKVSSEAVDTMGGKEDNQVWLLGINVSSKPKWLQLLICGGGFFFGYMINGVCEVSRCYFLTIPKLSPKLLFQDDVVNLHKQKHFRVDW